MHKRKILEASCQLLVCDFSVVDVMNSINNSIVNIMLVYFNSFVAMCVS